MRKLFAISVISLLVFSSCQQEPTGNTVTKPKELADPELAISGVPGSAIESGTSFNVLISSKSDGAVTLPEATREGFLFDGWYAGDTWVGKGGDSYQATADVAQPAKV